jgi:ferredoxin
MRVYVDPEVCQGYAQCNSLLPEMFEVDDDGTARVLTEEVPASLANSVTAVVARCPTGALRLEEPDRDV